MFRSISIFIPFILFTLIAHASPSESPTVPEVRAHRPSPSPSPGGSICSFKCPVKDSREFPLGKDSATDSRLYCTYPVSETGDSFYRCKYNKVRIFYAHWRTWIDLHPQYTGVLLSNPGHCPEAAYFNCPSTTNGKRVARDTFGTRSDELPQFVRARALAKRAVNGTKSFCCITDGVLKR
jgi:hypothetical protein